MATDTQAEERTERADLRVVPLGGDDGPRQALALLEHAHRVAEETMSTARTEAERLLMAARHDAQELRVQAKEQADREVSEAEREAEAARVRAHEEAERMVAEARGEVAELEQVKERLSETQHTAAETARALAQRLLDAAGDQFPRQSS